MSPELSKTINIIFPYLIMDGGAGTLLRPEAARVYIEALAGTMGMTVEEVTKYLEDGGKVQFTWAEDEQSQTPNESSC